MKSFKFNNFIKKTIILNLNKTKIYKASLLKNQINDNFYIIIHFLILVFVENVYLHKFTKSFS